MAFKEESRRDGTDEFRRDVQDERGALREFVQDYVPGQHVRDRNLVRYLGHLRQDNEAANARLRNAIKDGFRRKKLLDADAGYWEEFVNYLQSATYDQAIGEDDGGNVIELTVEENGSVVGITEIRNAEYMIDEAGVLKNAPMQVVDAAQKFLKGWALEVAVVSCFRDHQQPPAGELWDDTDVPTLAFEDFR